jgi:hypothetical protein
VASWEAERRLDYIDYRMATAGSINRLDIMRTFGVSEPQASKDISTFIRIHPNAIAYDKFNKRYVPSPAVVYRTRRGMTERVILLLTALSREGHPMGWR